MNAHFEIYSNLHWPSPAIPAYGYQQPPPAPGYAGGYAPQQQVVYTQGHKKKGGLGGMMSGNKGKMAAGTPDSCIGYRYTVNDGGRYTWLLY